VSAFRVKLGAINDHDLNCVGVPLNPILTNSESLTPPKLNGFGRNFAEG